MAKKILNSVLGLSVACEINLKKIALISFVVLLTGGLGHAQTLNSPAAPQKTVTIQGVDPTGRYDSALAIRQALTQSNVNYVLPPGTYLLKSTVSSPCCANNPSALLVSNLSNFSLTGPGATLVVDDSIALSDAILFNQDSNFSVSGLTIQGSRHNLNLNAENAGITLDSDVNFVMNDLHFSGDFGGYNGAGFAGDWLVNGTISNVQMDAVGQCVDLAFLNNVTISNIYAHGGSPGQGQIGTKCISVINDGPNALQNNTGVVFTNTIQVNVREVKESNFAVGAYISAGSFYNFTHNLWYDNPGIGGSRGIGIFIDYINGGIDSSSGVPVSNVTIKDDVISGNGAVTPGWGIIINPAAIPANSNDMINNIVIMDTLFQNNATIGLDATTSTKLSNVIAIGNTFTGANQTTSIGSNIKGSLNSEIQSLS